MAASDHLSPDQFLHGTAARLRRGDLIVPGHGDNYPGQGEPDKHEHVYATTSMDDARDHAYNAFHSGGVSPLQAEMSGRAMNVYSVDFTGPHEADPETPDTSRRSRHPLRVRGLEWTP
jgi:hypothetical protein